VTGIFDPTVSVPAAEPFLIHGRERYLSSSLNLVQAGVVEIAARRPSGADRSDHLVSHLDDDAPAQQQQMRQFEQVRNTGTAWNVTTSRTAMASPPVPNLDQPVS
jgi:hypothetical protein